VPFWLSWILLQAVLCTIETCLLVGFAHAFQFHLVSMPHVANRLALAQCAPCVSSLMPSHLSGMMTQFTRNAFLLGFLLILEVSLAMSALAFLTAGFLRKVRLGTTTYAD